MKLCAIAVALATALTPIATSAAETVAMDGGGPVPPPASSAGPNAGVAATSGEPAPPARPRKVGQVPHPTRKTPLSRRPKDCNKTICAHSNGRG
jgi:hypothetical protein